MRDSGTGSEVMQRIAAPMVGCMVTVTLLGLLVLPLIYELVLQWCELRRVQESFRFEACRWPVSGIVAGRRMVTPGTLVGPDNIAVS